MCAMELVLVIEDEFRTRRQVCDQLERADYRVLTASDAEVGMKMLRRENPDLLVVDAGITCPAGWSLPQQVRLEPCYATMPILMMAPGGQGKSIAKGLAMGADDYVLKPFKPRELVRRVQALLSWKKGQADQPIRLFHGEIALDLGGKQVSVRDEIVDLTPAQFSLLALFMSNPGHVFSRQQLLEKSLGYSEEGTSRTLDTHIRNLRQKIETNPHSPVYIHTVPGRGYRFSCQGEKQGEVYLRHSA